MSTKVGILVVHGIGETKKFENIQYVAGNIAAALRSDPKLSVRIILNTRDDGIYGGSQQTWLADEKSPLVIEVKEQNPNDPDHPIVTEMFFNETWWADLGKSKSAASSLSILNWGISLWTTKQDLGKKEVKQAAASQARYGTLDQVHLAQTVCEDKTPQMKPLDRLRFFVVSWVTLLILPLLIVLNFVLRNILAIKNIKLDPNILLEYLGDIKHYQQDHRDPSGAGYLIDMGQPPRVSVRRRMITSLVRMGLADYDRWYILAHSQGTVVAFNGLMEPDAVLPNYLNNDLWNICRESNLLTTKTSNSKDNLTEEKSAHMFPARPAWLGLDDIISRKDLFRKLRGFMTYGSPLSKFAVVWPKIVPINKDNSVFSSDFDWINVYDPTDPVADKTKYFNLEDYGGKPVVEIPYKAEYVHLLSHVAYLDYNSRRVCPLVKQVSFWILRGSDIHPAPQRFSLGWPNRNLTKIYTLIRYLIWFVAAGVVSWLLSRFVPGQVPESIKTMLNHSFPFVDLAHPLFYFIGTASFVLIYGCLRRLKTDLVNADK